MGWRGRYKGGGGGGKIGGERDGKMIVERKFGHLGW